MLKRFCRARPPPPLPPSWLRYCWAPGRSYVPKTDYFYRPTNSHANLNVLIQGLMEAPAKPGEENLGESRADTLMIFRRFHSEGLQIVEPSSITLVDIHRLPQRPSAVEFGKTKTRPIIVKLATQDDKNRIYQSLKFLKFYNRQEVNPYTGKRNPNVYVTYHLFREFKKQRTLLLPLFKAARKDKKKTSWRAENGRYNLYIEGQKADQ